MSLADLTGKCGWRPAVDIALDWILILLSVVAVQHFYTNFCFVLALLVIGNRQRALGNLLHEAAHGNLVPGRLRNDVLAYALLAPATYSSLAAYRRMHARHHGMVGDQHLDPDHINIGGTWRRHWTLAYFRVVFSIDRWSGSLLGDLRQWHQRPFTVFAILCWWAVVSLALFIICGSRYIELFAVLWWLSRATIFHAITSFREMCDHYGLPYGGIFSVTRDLSLDDRWVAGLAILIHPHNNGYHLTHHLLPNVPYYNLPRASTAIGVLPVYRAEAHRCSSYTRGNRAMIREWADTADA
ncbi:hypothetical protein UC34_24800 (plasmid) [Pandoraea vervacti]|uniref:Fatty acid desaturase domain-containing protein n=1 Tax=Pandoraea vervacti TaxID=656178 RepID=A0ABN4U824_9BURK|nr:hypothetical protein UC34_24800 [Pandoraea vervacti]